MNPDPGWGSAIKWGLVAVLPFVRQRAMSVRPAITAARALTLAGVIGPLIILGRDDDVLKRWRQIFPDTPVTELQRMIDEWSNEVDTAE